MWLYYGEEPFLINREVKTKIKSLGIEPTFFDEQDSIEKILMEITTISMFFDQKLLVIKNHSVLSKNDESTELIAELDKIDTSVKIIFVWEGILPNNNLIKYLSKKAEIKEFKKIAQQEILPLIKEIVASKEGEITAGVSVKLANKLPNDLMIIIREIDKLLLENRVITEEMVENSIGDYAKDDFFAISNALISQDAREIISTYRERVSNGDDAHLIISSISKTLLNALQVDAFCVQGFNNQEISERMKIHIFRVKRARDLLEKTTIERIRYLIKSLAELDEKIKIKGLNDQLALDAYIVKLI